MTEENSATEDEEKRRAEYARKLVREKRSRMGLQSGKCHACGVPCDPKYGIYCTICSSKQNAMRAEATRMERESQEKRRADRQKRREEWIKQEEQKDKMRKEAKERRRIEELERRAERERAEREPAKRRQQQAKKDAIVARKRAEAAKKNCISCGGKSSKLTINKKGMREVGTYLKKYVDEEGWFKCPSCGNRICGNIRRNGTKCNIHGRDRDIYEDRAVCWRCCDTTCGQCCRDCHGPYDECDCSDYRQPSPLSIRDHLGHE